jgi:hypothetical protein
MLIDVKKEKRQINRASRAAYGGPHMTHIHRLTVTAELGEGRDRDRQPPTCPENPTVHSADRASIAEAHIIFPSLFYLGHLTLRPHFKFLRCHRFLHICINVNT